VPEVLPQATDADEAFLVAVKKRWDYCFQAWEPILKESRQCWDFRMGEQWPSDIVNRRTAEGRPCITVNWTDQFVLHVTNSQRQNEPEVGFLPVSAGLDDEDAKWRKAMYRHIEDYSQADTARDTAFEQSVTGGLGYWRVTTEYCDEELNLQEVCIRPIEDASTVYMDPKPKRLKDVRYPQYCFVVEDIQWDDYKETYGEGDAVVMGLDSWEQAANNAPEGWVTKETVRLAEYFYIDPKDKMCKWARISAWRVLERRDIGIPFIPIVQDRGEEIIYNGKRRIRGLVWNLRDAQQTLNYATSALSEAAGMGPKAPYMVTPKMIEGLEAYWDKINKSNLAYCVYNPDPEQPNGPRQENTAPPIAPMVEWCQQAEERFRMLTGIYAAAQGAPSNEISGKAINARKVEGELAVYHFIDNHTRAMEYEALVVDALMKVVYDAPRVMRITKPDNSAEVMVIGQAFNGTGDLHPNLQSMDEDELNEARDEKGDLRYYDPTEGDYNVVVHVGPSSQTQIQEANEGMATFAQAAPELVPQWAYIWVRNQTWRGKDEIADAVMPPSVAAAKQAGSSPAAQVSVLSQQLMQAKQQLQQLGAEFQKLVQEKQGKVVETQGRTQVAQMDNQVKLQTTAMQTHAQLVGKMIEAKTDLSLAAAERQMQHLHHYSNLQHEVFTKQHDSAHEHAMEATKHGNSMELAEQAAKLTPKPDEDAWTEPVQ
jgi:hypothetical protein